MMKRVMLMMSIAAMLVACGSVNSKKSDDKDDEQGVVVSDSSVQGVKEAIKKPDAPKRLGWDFPALYGDVEQVKVVGGFSEEFMAASNMSVAVGRGLIIWNFNEDGDVVERLEYDGFNELIRRDTEFVDNTSINDDNGCSITRYDDNGNIVAEGYEEDNKFIPCYIYEYDAAGNKIKYSILRADGVVMTEFIYIYDEYGNRLETATYSLGDSPRTLTEKYTMTYDSYGNVVKMENYSAAANMMRAVFTYEITYRN